MTPEDKGRFCASCRKVVYDFTRSSDREIASVLAKENNACGRFLSRQLNRDLVVPKEKSNAWMAASAAIFSFLSFGNNFGFSQNVSQTEQYEKKITNPVNTDKLKTLLVTGTVVDDTNLEVPGVIIYNERLDQEVLSDTLGRFSIQAEYGDTISYSFEGFNSGAFVVNDLVYNIELEYDPSIFNENIIDVYGRLNVQRTFFGRIFHSIGNLFR